MRKRITSITVAVAALGALALGGSALASAASSPAPEKVSATDTGPAVQQGDQTTPDAAPAAKTHGKLTAADPAGPNDTTSKDTGPPVSEKAASENAPENASENASENAPSDGPGGFADANTTADTQQQGEH